MSLNETELDLNAFEDSKIAPSKKSILAAKAKSDNFYNIFLFAVLVILIAVVVYYLFTKIRQSRQITETKIGRHYDHIFGDVYDQNVDELLHAAEEKTLRPIDNYRVGVVQFQNVGDVDAGNRFFQRAIREIIDDPNDADAVFIIDGIEDFRRADNRDLFEILEHARNLVLDAHITEIRERKFRELPKNDDPQYVPKSILAKQSWHRDSQNVHDAKMTEVMLKQFQQVKAENKKKDLRVDYMTIRKMLLENTPQDKQQNLINVLDTIERNDDVNKYVDEIEIIETVAARAMDPANEANRAKIFEALSDSLCDASNGTNSVCLTGRSKLIWQSLALLDFDPEIGIMKSTQMVRNEIIEKVAKIVLEEEQKATPETLAAYTKGENTEEVRLMKQQILNRIEDIREEYREIANSKDINMILAECTAEIN